MSYDREVLKIPLKQLRKIQARLNPSLKVDDINPISFFIGKDLDRYDTDEKYSQFVDQFKKGSRDSAFLRRLTLIAFRKQDSANFYNISKAFMLSLKTPFSYDNLTFFRNITSSTSEFGFGFFIKNREMINKVLEGNAADNLISYIIGREITEILDQNRGSQNLDTISQREVNKYGNLFERSIWSSIANYAYSKKNVSIFVHFKDKLHQRYFLQLTDGFEESSNFAANNDAYWVFENSNNIGELEIAIEWIKKVMKNEMANPSMNDQSRAASIDTYANLLYKSGKKAEAIAVEEKVVSMSSDAEFKATLQKMKAGN